MLDKHDLISRLKDLAIELGRTPTRDEFRKMRSKVEAATVHHFGSFATLVQAAELDAPLVKDKKKKDPSAAYRSLCSKREQIQGFFRETLDLKLLFSRAGNPEVLTLVAQPDTHMKYRDVPALNAFTKFCEDNNPDVHMIMGDYLDCEGISHWPSDSLEPKRLIPEIKLGREILGDFVKRTPKTSTRLFLKGNHEHWIEQAFVRMPELFDGLAELGIEISLKTLLDLPGLGYELFELNHLVQIGKAHFTHGIFYGNGHAKKHVSTFKANIYYGHLHDTEESNQTSIDGPIEAASLGCLCRLDAKFLRGKPNNWQHAFGYFSFFRDGSYCFSKMRIINGRIAFNGKVYDGN